MIFDDRKLESGAIVWDYLRDPMFSRFHTIGLPECDRHTDRHTDTLRRHRSSIDNAKNSIESRPICCLYRQLCNKHSANRTAGTQAYAL